MIWPSEAMNAFGTMPMQNGKQLTFLDILTLSKRRLTLFEQAVHATVIGMALCDVRIAIRPSDIAQCHPDIAQCHKILVSEKPDFDLDLGRSADIFWAILDRAY